MGGEQELRRPQVSVVVTTWNGSAFIERQLDSLMGQTRIPDEIVIADDASTDDTLDRVRAFATRGGACCKVLPAAENVGLLANVERGLRKATGDFVFLCDQDDVWRPGKVARFLEAFEDEAVAAVFSDATLVDGDLRPMGPSLWSVEGFGRSERKAVREGRLMEILVDRNVVQGASLAFRRCWLPAVLPIPRNLHTRLWCHDGWIVAVLSVLGPIVPLESETLLYRVHGNNQVARYSRFNSMRRWLPRTGRILARSWTQARECGSLARVRKRDLDMQFCHMRLVLDRWKRLVQTEPNRERLTRWIEWLETALAHHKRRRDFPVGLASRFRAVQKEWKSGGYRTAPGGWRGFLRDLFDF